MLSNGVKVLNGKEKNSGYKAPSSRQLVSGFLLDTNTGTDAAPIVM